MARKKQSVGKTLMGCGCLMVLVGFALVTFSGLILAGLGAASSQ